MFDEGLIFLLKENIFNILESFGGVDQFLYFLLDRLQIYEEVYNEEEKNIVIGDLYKILSAKNNIIIISPYSLRFKLYDDNYYEGSSVLLEEPYSVFNSKGELLYRVSDHRGIFGLSNLDKKLILSSSTTSIYYLNYLCTDGESKIILLLVNREIQNTFKNNDKLHLPDREQEESLFNRVRFLTEISDLVNIYYLPTINSYPLTKEELKDNPNTQVTSFTGLVDFTPPSSGWVYLEKSNGQPLNVERVSGLGFEQFVSSSTGIHYLALGDIKNINIVSQNLNQQIINREESINIEVSLI